MIKCNSNDQNVAWCGMPISQLAFEPNWLQIQTGYGERLSFKHVVPGTTCGPHPQLSSLSSQHPGNAALGETKTLSAVQLRGVTPRCMTTPKTGDPADADENQEPRARKAPPPIKTDTATGAGTGGTKMWPGAASR